MAHKLRFAALIRVSTEQQEKTGESLRTQRSENERAVKQLGGVITEWYGGQEHATPGYEKREIDRLLSDATKAKFDAVIMTNADRWSRDNAKSTEGLKVFEKHKTRVFVGTSEYDLFNPEHCLFLGMSAVIGQFYAQNQKRKSLTNRIHRAKRGLPSTGKLPFGRTFDKKSGKWGIDPAKKAIIEDVAKRYLAGERMADLAEEYGMNHSNLHKVLTHRSGTRWTQEFHSEDLNIHEDVETEIPALLTDETIHAVRKRTQMNKTYEHGQAKHPYLLSGFIFCGHCGYTMFGQTNAPGRRYYRHAHAKRKRACTCPKSWVRANDIEEVVIRQLFDCFGNPAGMQQAIAAATPNLEELNEHRERLKRLEGHLAQIGNARVSILKFISKGSISEADAEKQLEELKAKEDRHLAEVHRVQESIEKAPSAESIREFAKSIASHVNSSSKRSTERRYTKAVETARLKSINRDFSSMTWDQKRSLITTIFNGTQLDGKPMGVFVKWSEDKASNKRWTYTINGNLIHQSGFLPVTDEDMDAMFGFTQCEVRSALYCTTESPHALRFF